MDKFFSKVFSMSLMAATLLIFFCAIAWATFVENDYGTPVAQKTIYKTGWFSGILFYLTLSLIYNIFRYKLFQLKKAGTLIFHISLIVIVAGAWITRNFGFEGVMTIREGAASNVILSSDTYIQIKVHDLNQQYVYDLPLILDTNVYSDENGKSDYSHNYFKHSFSFPGADGKVEIEFKDLIPNIKDTLVATQNGNKYLELVTLGDRGREYNYLESGKILNDGGIKVSFNNSNEPNAIKIIETDSGLFILSPIDISYLQMSDQSEGVIIKDSIQHFIPKRLYNINGFSLVFNAYYPSANLDVVSNHAAPNGFDGMKLKISQGDLTHEVVVRGGKGFYPTRQLFQMGDLYYELAWGSKIVELPFSIYLRDFDLERYPGTMNPSSFASEVTVIDHTTGQEQEHRIFMNNVLDYGGYRFFQSSYDGDEKGTILSVNYDVPGTWTTYIGYLLLGLGFIVNLISRDSRFRTLVRKSKELKIKSGLSAIILLMVCSLATPINSTAQVTRIVDLEHSEKFSRLVIQDQGGRLKPVHTLATELLHKVYRKDTYNDMTAMQVFLGIHTNNLEWNLEPLIALPNSEIAKKLGLPEGEDHACIQDFITPEMTYIFQDEVQTAQMKRPALQSKFDKDILKVDERFNIMLGVFSGYYFKVIPLNGDSTNTWYSPFDPSAKFEGEEAQIIDIIMRGYFQGVEEGYQTGNWSSADLALTALSEYQKRTAPLEVMPSAELIEWEIRYNKMNLFKRLGSVYGLLGVVLLILSLIAVFTTSDWMKWPLKIGVWLFGFAFVLHGFGLGLRWYISGHAPWSNGYEALVFVSFIVIFAGLLFFRINKIILGAAGFLAWLILFVAQMSALDPQITQLVPVLKSYWLQIHVSVITGSYAVLGLGAILGLVNLSIYIFSNSANQTKIGVATKQLTYVIEMSLIIGLFMLTIGTFLGGVWANESWGRYWGWDAKETWALASVVMYSIILHFRFIPGLKSQFAMNVAALWGYSTIIMTFFGVNFYLSGLHSYAQGDPVPIPMWIPVTVFLLFCLTILSYLRYRLTFKNQ